MGAPLRDRACGPDGPEPRAASQPKAPVPRAARFQVLSLFAGIGGFDLGLERTGGFETVAFCEIEPFCQRVLAKHWPGVPIYDDVRNLTGERLAADGIAVDCIVGGFPCQDISIAGKGAGLAGERSGLFSEIVRLARELGPSYLILENVAALLSRGLGDVLGALAEIGYDAEWHCIPAYYVGSPQTRDRVWIVAYPMQQGRPWRGAGGNWGRQAGQGEAGRVRWPRLEASNDQLWPEPSVDRVADGVQRSVDAINTLGNAVVPQIPELIGRAILAAEQCFPPGVGRTSKAA